MTLPMRPQSCFILITLALPLLLGSGCSSAPKESGPAVVQADSPPSAEAISKAVYLDPAVQESVRVTSIREQRAADGRLLLVANIRNLLNRRIEVQADCVFKDAHGFPTDDESSFQTLILTENAEEGVRFASLNAEARTYTIRIRQAR
jgi:hypothetical protein